MDNKDLILAIDNGTQSLKALIFDLEGRLLFKERVPFKPYFSEHPGWAEQDPLLFWQALCDACNGLWQQGGVDKERIAGVAVTTQRGTVVNVDNDGKPLRPAIIWLDQRKTYGLPPVGGIWGILFKLSGVSGTVAYLQSEAEVNWIRTKQPEIWKETHKFLLLSGYLTYRLTGKFVDSIGCQVGYIPFDYKHLRWSSDWDWKWKAVPMDPDLLPKLIPPGKVLGQITGDAAEETGIPAGLPLIAAAADKACEVIGS
ncbi:MAG: carbohydrate kinase, partial [Deltaproteobacteria bacterium]|nr:carbohydrate kinase [Deltaproteobacteria bacterium]